MQTCEFGRTGSKVSRLTFGCGAVGGLMTRGEAADQDNAVAWARDNGITFFDTAASYGNGASETNLGRALNGNTDGLFLGTKVGLHPDDMDDIPGAIERSLNASLSRLKLDHVDLFQLHNTIGRVNGKRVELSPEQVLNDVLPGFERMRDAGKIRFIGFTANGEAAQLHELIESGRLDSAQIFYNLLVHSAGEQVPTNYPAEDYKQLITAAKNHGVGAIGVRVLAGGALSGTESRHPLGMPTVAPIGSPTDYATDVQRALRFKPLIEAGFVATLPELAVRYVISNPELPTTEIGIANLDQLQQATTAVNNGPLPAEALTMISEIQASLA